jgi:peroxiredoxin
MSTQELSPGDRVPETTFNIVKDGVWSKLAGADLFAGKRVVLFALPGAFTPTCSSMHLPGFVAHAGRLAEAGVDAVYCLSVNDSFVMNAWAKDQRVDGEVLMLPDGNGAFTRAMGMLVDKSELGFGERSWRYAMVVDDGVIERMFVEDRAAPGDPFAVSDVGTVLGYLETKGERRAASS